MPQSYLIFDFDGNEEAAQQARHKIDGWKRGFRLGTKLEMKFDRQAAEEPAGKSVAAAAEKGSRESSAPTAPAAGKSAAGKDAEKNAASSNPPAAESIRVLVRLDFSDHEKLSHQRWLDRIPAEEPFKAAQSQIVRPGDAAFASTAETFRSLT